MTKAFLPGLLVDTMLGTLMLVAHAIWAQTASTPSAQSECGLCEFLHWDLWTSLI